MNKSEFLYELRNRIRSLPTDEAERAIAYFEEIINDRIDEGMTEEAAVISLGSIESIAAELSAEHPADEPGGYGEDEVREIVVEDTNCAVILRTEPGTQVLIDYTENEKKHYKISLVDGRLIVRGIAEVGIFNIIRLWPGMMQTELVVTVPQEFVGAITLRTRNANITAADAVIDGDLTMKTTNATITATELSVKGSLALQTSNGRVNIENVDATSIHTKTTNGRIEVAHVNVSSVLTLETSNASVAVHDVEAAESIFLRTTNGKISGDLRGDLRDYSVRSRTSNGRNSLPTELPGGQKLLEAYTSNAAIDIKFGR